MSKKAEREMTYRKKLIEVALPLEAINAESSRRKRKAPSGYPTTLHKWWAQRPLAACRAVLFASLVDDPSSDPMFGGDEDIEASKRAELFNLIEELVQWENSTNPRVINKARAEIARCIASQKIETGELKKEQAIAVPQGGGGNNAEEHYTPHDIKHMLASPGAVNHFLTTYGPPVLDPFCGAGSIPLEAQRLGLRAFGTDLNPVPVLITKALIELPSKFAGAPPVNPNAGARFTSAGATGLAEDIRQYAAHISDLAYKKLRHLYPSVRVTAADAKGRPELASLVGQELPVVAWMWARTVASPNPACEGAHVPLVSSFWLSTKRNVKAWIEPVINQGRNSYQFEVRSGTPPASAKREISAGTKLGRGCKFRCLLSREPIPENHVKAEGMAERLGLRLMAIAAESPDGRVYLSPRKEHEDVAEGVKSQGVVAGLEVPIAEDKRALWCVLYGLLTFDRLFTNRQMMTAVTFSDLIGQMRKKILCDAIAKGMSNEDDRSLCDDGRGARAYADAVSVYLAFVLSRAADYNSALASWRPKDNAMRSSLAKQGLPVVWDFAEANPFQKSSAGFRECATVVAKCLDFVPLEPEGNVSQLDATAATPGDIRPLICTDPPYYDNIGYADLSDYLYVWLRRSLSNVFPSLFSTLVTPKTQELIASPYRHGGNAQRAKEFFEGGLGASFERARGIANPDYPVSVFYAFKQTESDEDDDDSEEVSTGTSIVSTGWETMLEGLIGAKFAVTGTWPMRTEGDNRQVGIGANALASSIVLVCRPRALDAPLATRKEFINALRRELPEALKNLQRGSIAPVDLAQASIGPGMAVFSRYSKVMETDGSGMTVRTALGLINQTLDEVLAEQESEFDGDTRWALAWFEQFGVEPGPFGQADVLARAKNTAVNGLVEAGVAKARAGKVQLLKRDELLDDWEPSEDKRLTIWEVTQYLIHALDQKGESGAAALLHRLGGLGETARDLAYRLYTICERKKWADEALAYNGLVIAWPELTKLARSFGGDEPPAAQTRLF